MLYFELGVGESLEDKSKRLLLRSNPSFLFDGEVIIVDLFGVSGSCSSASDNPSIVEHGSLPFSINDLQICHTSITYISG